MNAPSNIMVKTRNPSNKARRAQRDIQGDIMGIDMIGIDNINRIATNARDLAVR